MSFTEKPKRWHHAIPTEWVLVETGDRLIFAEALAKVKIHDEGAGPFLGVEFSNDEPTDQYSAHEGYFTTHDEIDAFARRLHLILDLAGPDNLEIVCRKPGSVEPQELTA